MHRRIDRAFCASEPKESIYVKALPNIGFDRCIARSWLDLALAIVADRRQRQELTALLEQDILGVEARSKTSIILNRMWLTPHPTLVEYSAEGVNLFKTNPELDTLVLHWGMALRSHPFFASIADSIGRLLKLHGEFAASQITRRLKEQYGDRASILRAAEAVLQTLVGWGVIAVANAKQRRFQIGMISTVSSPDSGLWVLEAAVAASGTSVALNAPINHLFPLRLPSIPEAKIASAPRMELQSFGGGELRVGMKKRAQ